MTLLELVRQANQLYSLPTICLQLQNAIAQQATVGDIAELATLDTALSARLLRLANSSFYSFPAQIDTVSRAVKLIGTNELYNLALATSAVSTFNRVPRFLLDMEAFWKHSLLTGLIARCLGKRLGYRQGERVFAAGLLHNVGLLMLIEQQPDPVKAIIVQGAGMPRPELEQEVLGFSFAEAGAALLEFWRLPPAMVSLVRHQNNPLAAGEESIAAALVLFGKYSALHVQAGFAATDSSDYLKALPIDLFAHLHGDGDQLAEAIADAMVLATQVQSIISGG